MDQQWRGAEGASGLEMGQHRFLFSKRKTGEAFLLQSGEQESQINYYKKGSEETQNRSK
jgi:hypothetical protein